MTLNIQKIRDQFPILKREIHGHPLVYLDNAATTQKPQQVIDSITKFYTQSNSNIHRGVHLLSQEATTQYEAARNKIAKFINAKPSEIIFTRGTTEGINLIAEAFIHPNLKEGDEILITHMEHHSNILPWQKICEASGAKLKVAPINDKGELVLKEFQNLLSPKTKLVAITHISNTLGTINPIKKIIELAHTNNTPVLIDGAQATPHIKVNIQDLDCDFYTFSGHKMYGPTGIGILYIKPKILKDLPPYQVGGGTIKTVKLEKTIYKNGPEKFEAGTPNIAGAIGLGAAIDFINELGHEGIAAHEHGLLTYATTTLSQIPGLKIIGTSEQKTSVISFVIENIHPHDVGTILDREGIAVRTGQHCTEPLMDRFQIPATTRVSLAIYNTKKEIDALIAALQKAITLLT